MSAADQFAQEVYALFQRRFEIVAQKLNQSNQTNIFTADNLMQLAEVPKPTGPVAPLGGVGGMMGGSQMPFGMGAAPQGMGSSSGVGVRSFTLAEGGCAYLMKRPKEQAGMYCNHQVVPGTNHCKAPGHKEGAMGGAAVGQFGNFNLSGGLPTGLPSGLPSGLPGLGGQTLGAPGLPGLGQQRPSVPGQLGLGGGIQPMGGMQPQGIPQGLGAPGLPAAGQARPMGAPLGMPAQQQATPHGMPQLGAPLQQVQQPQQQQPQQSNDELSLNDYNKPVPNSQLLTGYRTYYQPGMNLVFAVDTSSGSPVAYVLGHDPNPTGPGSLFELPIEMYNYLGYQDSPGSKKLNDLSDGNRFKLWYICFDAHGTRSYAQQGISNIPAGLQPHQPAPQPQQAMLQPGLPGVGLQQGPKPGIGLPASGMALPGAGLPQSQGIAPLGAPAGLPQPPRPATLPQPGGLPTPGLGPLNLGHQPAVAGLHQLPAAVPMQQVTQQPLTMTHEQHQFSSQTANEIQPSGATEHVHSQDETAAQQAQ